jgi:DegV family protein with EDD domain
MEYITGKDLYQMFNYGAYFIMKERTYLNDINVFPVADGDTGNNLLQTLRTIVLESKQEESFTKTLDSISDAALIGARGNSGVIFAQFVNGLQKANPMKEKITFQDFALMVEESYHHIVSSLSNPVEGTMLTIIREWGQMLKDVLKHKLSIREAFVHTYESIKKVLQKTKTMMDLLSEKDVVDSGAMGFVLFIQGIQSYYNNEEVDVEEYEEVELTDEHHFESDVTYRYCTEGLVKYYDINEAEIQKALQPYGDSLIVAQGKQRFRVHIHTNHPEKVFHELKQFGELETQKIDDMVLDMKLKNTNAKRVLVTDSIADIDPKILDENNVVVIPINIAIDNIPYLDKLSINNKLLFDDLDQYLEYPNTATPSVKYINDLFSRLFLRFDEILVITVSEQLSATHTVIKNEALKLNKKGKQIHVIDSYNNSATEGLLVQEAIRLMKEDVPTQEIVKVIQEKREKTRILVCLETFKYAMMSGRLPKVVGKIGMFFGLRPIMSLKEGKGTAFGMAFSQKGINKKIRKLVEHDLQESGIESYSLVHCMNEELVKEYQTLFTEIIGKEPSYITEISSATAIHSGIGSVAIGYIKK